MVAVPMTGLGPYGSSQKSARSSTTDASKLDTPKLDASQVEDIFQQMNTSQERRASASSSSRRGWFSRQYSKTFNRRDKSESK